MYAIHPRTQTHDSAEREGGETDYRRLRLNGSKMRPFVRGMIPRPGLTETPVPPLFFTTETTTSS